MGLNSWARGFVLGETVPVTEIITHVFPDGSILEVNRKEVQHSFVKAEPSGEFAIGMFFYGEDDVPLTKYTFPNGKVYFEKIQTTHYSSGPVTFTALQDEDGHWLPFSLWEEVESQVV